MVGAVPLLVYIGIYSKACCQMVLVFPGGMFPCRAYVFVERKETWGTLLSNASTSLATMAVWLVGSWMRRGAAEGKAVASKEVGELGKA